MNQQSNNRISIMRDEPVAASLMKLGVPTMIGMLISALYNAIDAYFVGGLGMSQMGAVSVVFPIVQIVSAPMIKCKKTPRKKCRFMAEEAKKR